jgi:ribonuclease HI
MSPAASNVQRRLLIVYTDGAARGNPGPAGAGVHIEDESGESVEQITRYLGETTNNVAEYRALLLGLEHAKSLGARAVEIRADSQLMIRQMTGEYRVRNPDLQELNRQARTLERRFEHVAYVHVSRDKNREADRLANRAIDAGWGREGVPQGSKKN